MSEYAFYARLFLLASLAAGLWVLWDARTRLVGRPAWEPFVWGLGTALALPVFLPLYLLGARSPDRSGTWGVAEIVGIAVVFAVTLPVVAGVLGVPEGGLSFTEVSLVLLVQNGGFVLLALFGILARYRLPAARLGLTTRRWAAMLLLGAVVGGAMIFVSLVAERASLELVGLVEGRPAAEARAEREHAADPLAEYLGISSGPARLIWLTVLLVVVVPFGEELYFRGVVYGGLRNRFGAGWSLLGSTLLFGAVHRQVVHFLPIALLGLVIALLYERTRSLLPSVAVHAVNNIISILARVYGWDI